MKKKEIKKKAEPKPELDQYGVVSISDIKNAEGEQKIYYMFNKIMWMIARQVPNELIEEIVLECGCPIQKQINITYEWKGHK